MANNKSILILRGSSGYDPNNVELLDGQPFYSKQSGKFYIGVDGNSKQTFCNEQQVDSKVSDEANLRLTADSVLLSNLNDEAALRQAADSDLLSKLDTETDLRLAADSNLLSKLDAEISRSTTFDNAHNNLENGTGNGSIKQKGTVTIDGYSGNIKAQALGPASVALNGLYKPRQGLTPESSGVIAAGPGSIAGGKDTEAYQACSFAFGGGNKAGLTEAEFNAKYTSGKDAHGKTYAESYSFATAEGVTTKATGYASHAENESTEATGPRSHASGQETYAKGNRSFATGYKTYATDQNAFTMGELTNATGINSLAGGFKSTSSNYCSIAFGENCTASDMDAVATGYYSQATGKYSFAAGRACLAGGEATVAVGRSNKTTVPYQFVCGTFCKENTADALFVVGGGSSKDDRANLFSVGKNITDINSNHLNVNCIGINFDCTPRVYSPSEESWHDVLLADIPKLSGNSYVITNPTLMNLKSMPSNDDANLRLFFIDEIYDSYTMQTTIKYYKNDPMHLKGKIYYVKSAKDNNGGDIGKGILIKFGESSLQQVFALFITSSGGVRPGLIQGTTFTNYSTTDGNTSSLEMSFTLKTKFNLPPYLC